MGRGRFPALDLSLAWWLGTRSVAAARSAAAARFDAAARMMRSLFLWVMELRGLLSGVDSGKRKKFLAGYM